MIPSTDPPTDASLFPARCCILVIEDELLIRYMISDVLRDSGYGVIEACNADEALQILHSLAPIEPVISDVRMPGSMDGLGLLAAIKATLPKLPVIMMSAHLEPRVAIVGGAAHFLAKPFAPQDLLDLIGTELKGNI